MFVPERAPPAHAPRATVQALLALDFTTGELARLSPTWDGPGAAALARVRDADYLDARQSALINSDLRRGSYDVANTRGTSLDPWGFSVSQRDRSALPGQDLLQRYYRRLGLPLNLLIVVERMRRREVRPSPQSAA
jgi:hypothetical protein